MDMAGFVIHITKLLNKPWVKMGFMTTKNKVRPVKIGHLETIYLEQFASQATVECRGSEKEASSITHAIMSYPTELPVGTETFDWAVTSELIGELSEPSVGRWMENFVLPRMSVYGCLYVYSSVSAELS